MRPVEWLQASLRDATILACCPWTEVHGYYQGSLREQIDRALSQKPGDLIG
jgi:hypothetical protein